MQPEIERFEYVKPTQFSEEDIMKFFEGLLRNYPAYCGSGVEYSYAQFLKMQIGNVSSREHLVAEIFMRGISDQHKWQYYKEIWKYRKIKKK